MKKGEIVKTTAKRDKFLHGFASVFDMSGGRLISIDDLKKGPIRDRDALAGDWVKVGRDIGAAMDREPCGQE
ncbi:MAG TPA: hypothetical protein VMV83_11375 [Rectinemataceae bacterium]|nr:hypothetical protein [Rectinemataceae bacterium]